MTDQVLTKAQLVNMLREKVGLSGQVTSAVVNDLFEIIKETISRGESVKVSGFGNFEVRKKKARRGRNPQTGAEMTIAARSVLTFKPSGVLRLRLNKKT